MLACCILTTAVCALRRALSNEWRLRGSWVWRDGQHVDFGVWWRRTWCVNHGNWWTTVGRGETCDMLRLRSADQGPLAAERRWSFVAWELFTMLVLSVRSCRCRVDTFHALRSVTLPPRLPQVSKLASQVHAKSLFSDGIGYGEVPESDDVFVFHRLIFRDYY